MTDLLREISLPVAGMTCAACDGHVDEALQGLPGVHSISVDGGGHRVRLTYNPAQTSLKELVRGIGDRGYLVMDRQLTLAVQGMTCSACVKRVEQALQAVPGVEEASVDLAAASARVKYVEGAVPVEAIVQAVRQAGYEAQETEGLHKAPRKSGGLLWWTAKKGG